MKTVWMSQCWRQQLTSTKQLKAALDEAQRLGFTHYHLLRSQSKYWLSCVELSSPTNALDRLAYIKHELADLASAMVLYVSAKSLFWVVWRETELVVASEVELTELVADSLAELIQFHYQQLPLGTEVKVFGTLPEPLAECLLRAEVAMKTVVEKTASTSEQKRRYGFVPLTRPPRAVWVKRGGAAVLMVLVTVTASWWFAWQQPRPTEAVVAAAQLWQPAGVGLEQLAQVVEFAQHSEHVAGWQLQTVELTKDGQLLAQAQASYGRLAELPLLISPAWQVSGTVENARWFTSLADAKPAESWWLTATSADPISHTQQLLQQTFASADVRSHGEGANESWRWQDWQVQWQPVLWDELDLLQWSPASPIRLLKFHYQPTAQYRLTLVIRIYQRVISNAESSS